MTEYTLLDTYAGWGRFNQTLIKAITPLTTDQLNWQPKTGFRSIGSITEHIVATRIAYLNNFDMPGGETLRAQIPWQTYPDGRIDFEDTDLKLAESAEKLALWLYESWLWLESVVSSFTFEKAFKSFDYPGQDGIYKAPFQRVFWRLLHHDCHHGGEISLMLGLLDIEGTELQEFVKFTDGLEKA